EAQHGTVVGDHAHGVVDLMRLAVQAGELLALPSKPRADGALQLVGIVDVQGAAAVQADVVGHIDQGVDRALAYRLQALLHPGGRHAVAHTADVAAGEARAGVACLLREVEPDVDRAVVVALDAGDLPLRLQLAEAGRREVAGDAAHAGAVRPV